MSEEQEYGRPRRPKPDTVSYINGLPLDETVAAQQAKEYVAYYQKNKNNESTDDDIEPPEYPPMLSAAHAALSSIYHEFASLACEEIPSQQVETLIRICCRYSIISKRIILSSMISYWTFLSTHRFGSHVAQTVLRCVVADVEVNLDDFDDGLDNEGKMVIEDSYGALLKGESGGGEAVVSSSQSLSKLLLQSIEELKLYATDLAAHVCGSHVLRTSLCILSGVEFIDAFAPPGSTVNKQGELLSEWDTGALAATRRGKLKDKKKKKKKRFNATADSEDKNKTPQEVTVMKEMKMAELQTDDSFHNSAESLMDEFVSIISFRGNSDDDGKVQPPGELQQQTCHPSAGPLLIQILRLLSYRDYQSKNGSKSTISSESKENVADRRLVILPQEPRYSAGSQAESLVQRLLCWDSSITTNNSSEGEEEEATAKQLYAGDIIYGLSGEPRGSILLEAIFRCCSDSFHDELCTVGGFYNEASLRDYIKHGVSNFVVQTLLTTVRSKYQASRMAKCLCSIIEDGSLLNAKEAMQLYKSKEDGGDATAVEENKVIKRKSPRMGVVWRAVEMCATKGSSQDQEQILSALTRGFATITGAASANDNTTDEPKNDEKKRKKRSKTKGVAAAECIPLLLGLTPGSYGGEGDNSRLTIDASGARTLYHILQFKERLRKDWVKSVLNIYTTDDLVKIANDGLGSRW